MNLRSPPVTTPQRRSARAGTPWLAAALVAAGCASQDEGPAGAPPPAGPAPPAADTAAPPAHEEGFLGVVLARHAVDLAPRAEGRVAAVAARLGDTIPQGGLVATVDLLTVPADLTAADAVFTAAQVEGDRAAVELSRAEENLARHEALAREGLTSQESLTAARYERDIAKLRVSAAGAQRSEKRARADALRQIAAYREIRAPFDAVVAVRYVDPGVNVTPATPIVRLISARDLLVRFAVPERRIPDLRVGLPVRVSVAGDGAALGGVVDKIAPEIDAASRMLFVEAAIGAPDDGDLRLRPGETARVSAAAPPGAAAPGR